VECGSDPAWRPVGILDKQHPDLTNGEQAQDQVDCLVEFLNTPDAGPPSDAGAWPASGRRFLS